LDVVRPWIGKERQGSVFLLVTILMFNNIAAPCIATAAFSSECFYDLFVPPERVDVSYTYPACIMYTKTAGDDLFCAEYAPKHYQTSYQPSFTYSHQCTSAFIDEYAPVFFIMYLMIALVIPVIQYASTVVHSCNNLMVSPTRSTRHSSNESSHRRSCCGAVLSGVFLLCGKFLSRTVKKWIELSRGMKVSNGSVSSGPEPHHIFYCDLFVATIIYHLAVVLTFGAMFPPLGVCGCVAIAISVFSAQLDIGRILVDMYSESSYSNTALTPTHLSQDKASSLLSNSYRSLLEKDCRSVGTMTGAALYMILPYLVVFYGLFVLDTLGPDASITSVAVMGTCVAIAPVVAWLVTLGWERGLRGKKKRVEKSELTELFIVP
jgi:hypothetical protein